MRISVNRPATVAVLLAVLLATAHAARFETGSSFTLPVEDTLAGDLYFGGSAFRLDGNVTGSVAAGCQTATLHGRVGGSVFIGAQTVDVLGPVGGDILAGGQTVTVDDSVGGAVRAVANSIRIGGYVGRDVLAGCGSLTITRDAVVAGDVIAGTGTLNHNGIVHGSVKAAGGEIIVAGIIDGDLVVQVQDRLVLTDEARIFGNLRYKAEKELDIGNVDAVFGDIEFTQVEEVGGIDDIRAFRPRPGLFPAFLLPFAIFSVLGALIVGFLLLLIWRHAIVHALDRARRRAGATVGYGALILLAAPAAIIIGFALILTIPASTIALSLYLMFLYLGKVLAGMFAGRWLFGLFGGESASIWLTAPVGIVLVYALCAIPIVGWIIWLFVAILGLGVILELLKSSRRP